jgi:hypothetical protein
MINNILCSPKYSANSLTFPIEIHRIASERRIREKKECPIMGSMMIGIIFLSFVLFSTLSSAVTIIDQINPYTDTNFEADPPYSWQQEVTVGVRGYLVGIDLYWFVSPQPPNNNVLDISINRGSAWQSDSNDFEKVVIFCVPNGWNHINVSPAALYFMPGDQFVIGVNNPYNNTMLGGSSDDEYPAGDLFLGGQNYATGRFDLAFRTYMKTTPIPEPSTMLLLASGLIGLVGYGRKKFFKK